MYDIAKEQRRNRVLIAVNLCLLVGALSLIVLGYRNLLNWLLLVSSFGNCVSTLMGRRALSRLSTALTYRDQRWPT